MKNFNDYQMLKLKTSFEIKTAAMHVHMRLAHTEPHSLHSWNLIFKLLNQSDRTGIGQLLPGPRTKNNWQRLKGRLLDLKFAHGESSISCLEWAGIK